MMNYLWAGMLIIGAVFAAANGNLSSFSDGLMASCGEAVNFMIGLAGIMAVWSGIMEIASKSGLIGNSPNLPRRLCVFSSLRNAIRTR